jgi:hypothetical protein
VSEHYVRWGRNDGKGGATEELFKTAQEADDFGDSLRDELNRDVWYVTVQHCLDFKTIPRIEDPMCPPGRMYLINDRYIA